jgi:hypothetical protein
MYGPPPSRTPRPRTAVGRWRGQALSLADRGYVVAHLAERNLAYCVVHYTQPMDKVRTTSP